MTQLDWLQGAFRYAPQRPPKDPPRNPFVPVLTDTPRARRGDPETSHAAADEVKRSGRLAAQQQIVLEAVRRWPGSTAVELAQRACMDRYVVSRRLPELVPVWVRRGPPKICSVNGRPQGTWQPVSR